MTALRWETDRGLAGLERHAARWDALARSGSLSPTADALWMRCFLGAFGGDEDVSLHLLLDGDDLLAVLPLRREGGFLRRWCSVANEHSPFWTCAVDERRPEAARAVLDHLLASADVVDLRPLHADGPLYAALAGAAQARRLPLARREATPEVFIPLFGPWEAFKLALPAKMRRETARKMRQLGREGELTFEVVTSGEALGPTLEECFDLETRGWKGAGGSPIKADPRAHRFYTDLARLSAAEGRFALYLLRLGGTLVAYEYSLRAQRRIDLLKPSFDPALSRYSPGNVLRYKVLEREVAIGEVATYSLGRRSEWKEHWTKHETPLCRLCIYGRRARSRAAFLAGPALRGLARRSALLRAAASRLKRRRAGGGRPPAADAVTPGPESPSPTPDD